MTDANQLPIGRIDVVFKEDDLSDNELIQIAPKHGITFMFRDAINRLRLDQSAEAFGSDARSSLGMAWFGTASPYPVTIIPRNVVVNMLSDDSGKSFRFYTGTDDNPVRVFTESLCRLHVGNPTTEDNLLSNYIASYGLTTTETHIRATPSMPNQYDYDTNCFGWDTRRLIELWLHRRLMDVLLVDADEYVRVGLEHTDIQDVYDIMGYLYSVMPGTIIDRIATTLISSSNIIETFSEMRNTHWWSMCGVMWRRGDICIYVSGDIRARNYVLQNGG